MSADGTLIIGTKRYSSWSLRGWLAVRLAGLDVAERVIALEGGPSAAVAAASPSGMVPVLHHRDAVVWDSLAIGEYCAEIEPRLWPEER
ncbi:MAG: glutathione S-transferase N-terminal domain-containing protein, partial [Gluconacetobacter diazotrophicus]|nr:glutathione S-transferase N-terminal domain-containing protein [Gluconacetobacter diazotrophicus]